MTDEINHDYFDNKATDEVVIKSKVVVDEMSRQFNHIPFRPVTGYDKNIYKLDETIRHGESVFEIQYRKNEAAIVRAMRLPRDLVTPKEPWSIFNAPPRRLRREVD